VEMPSVIKKKKTMTGFEPNRFIIQAKPPEALDYTLNKIISVIFIKK
jgi:hypothetical protein